MIQFICPPCKNASQSAWVRAGISGATADRIQKAHELCKGGTWCDCQHRVKK